MSLLDKRTCKPCCKQGSNCNQCVKCLPRWLCVNVVITPPEYDDNCHCPGVNQRISSSGCGWEGVVSCGPDSLSVSVEIEKDNAGHCFTVVYIPEIMQYPIDFAGTLPAIAISGVDDNGVGYDITITKPDTFINPRSSDKCAICMCATCLPRQLCIIFSGGCPFIDGNPVVGPREDISTIATWDCYTETWESEPLQVCEYDTLDLTLRLASPDDGVGCAIIGSIGGIGNMEFVIPLESPSGFGVAAGISCVENGMALKRGAGGSIVNSFAIVAGNIIVTDYSGTQLGTLTIRDHSCGGDCTNPCPQTCDCHKFPPPPPAGDGPMDVTMSGGGEAFGMHYSGSPGATQYANTGTHFGTQVTTAIKCDPTDAGHWILQVTYEPGSACFGQPTATYHAKTAFCPPLDLTFTGVDFCGRTVNLTVTE